MTMDLGTLAILFPMLFLLLGLGVTVVIDPYIQQKQRRIMLLPESFDVAECERMDWSVSTMDQVAVLSQKVWSFCDRHGCDPRRRYLMSLSVEEMVGNVIQHGFTKDKKRHHIDVRILKKKEDYIVRIRDDCAFFDPIERLQLYSERDPLHHVGLRMISKTAKSIQYTCVLKLNNLVVRI